MSLLLHLLCLPSLGACLQPTRVPHLFHRLYLRAGAIIQCPHPQIRRLTPVADSTGLCSSPLGPPTHHQAGCNSGVCRCHPSVGGHDPEEGTKALGTGLFLHPRPAFIPQQSQLVSSNAWVSLPSTTLDTPSLAQDASLPSPESFPLPRWLYSGG